MNPQIKHWLDKLDQAPPGWNGFSESYKAFLGFSRALADDAAARGFLLNLVQGSANQATVDRFVQAVRTNVPSAPSALVTPLFQPPIASLENCVSMLVAFVRDAPSHLVDTIFRESGLVMDSSLELRRALKALVMESTDAAKPTAEACIIYVFGNLLSNTNLADYADLLFNENHIPFNPALLRNAATDFASALRFAEGSKGQVMAGEPRLLESKKNWTLAMRTIDVRRWRWPLAFVLVAIVVGIIAMTKQSGSVNPVTPMVGTDGAMSAKLHSARQSNESPPQWVFGHGSTKANTAVVFVHGIFGDTLDTWLNAATKKHFYDLIAEDPSFKSEFDILAFGYPSNMVRSGSFSIEEAANRLFADLRHYGAIEYPRVVFVAHSMGGLVVLRMLIAHRELLPKVPLVMLLATPQEGSQITVLARQLLANPALEDMLPAERNTFLQALNDDWKGLGSPPRRPHVSCAYEKLPIGGFIIVPWSSATRFCDEAADAVDADHLDIVKPKNADSASFIAVSNALKAFVLVPFGSSNSVSTDAFPGAKVIAKTTCTTTYSVSADNNEGEKQVRGYTKVWKAELEKRGYKDVDVVLTNFSEENHKGGFFGGGYYRYNGWFSAHVDATDIAVPDPGCKAK